jgi:hypothetical protein
MEVQNQYGNPCQQGVVVKNLQQRKVQQEKNKDPQQGPKLPTHFKADILFPRFKTGHCNSQIIILKTGNKEVDAGQVNMPQLYFKNNALTKRNDN